MKKLSLLLVLSVAVVNIAHAQKKSITPNGIEGITVGNKISNQPSNLDGVYDKIRSEEREDMGEMFTCHIFMKNGVAVAEVEDYAGQGEIFSVEVLSPEYEVEGISVGTPVAQVFGNPKAKQVHQRDGQFYFEINNMAIIVGEFSEAGYDNLRVAYSKGEVAKLSLSDFKSNAVVTSIICNGGGGEAATSEVVTTSEASSDPIGATMQNAMKNKKDDSSDLIISIILSLVFAGATAHMVIASMKGSEDRVFVGSIMRMILVAILCLLPVIFGFGKEVGFLRIILQIGGVALFLVFYYYAYCRPVSLFLKDKPGKSGFFNLPGIWDVINFDSARIDRERNRQYDKEIEKAQNKINNEYLTPKEYEEQRSKINNAETGKLTDSLFLMAFRFMVIGAISFVYIALTPFVAFYNYLKNYIFYKNNN